MKPAVLLSAFLLLTSHFSFAGSATWNLNPVTDNVWHNAANWTPATVPNSDADTATFGVSNTTTIRVTKYAQGLDGLVTTLDKLIFAEGASSYSIRVIPAGTYGVYLALDGEGVINDSGVMQSLVVAVSGDFRRSASLSFHNTATAGGANIVITNQGGASAAGDSTYGAYTVFQDSSTAATATFVNEGSTASGTVYGGFTNLLYSANADSATFINNPGAISGAAAGHTFVGTSPPGTIGSSTFINNAATVAGAEGGWTEIDGGISAGATFIANGATVAGAQGGQVYAFGGDGYSTYTAEGGNGTNAQGGLIDVLYVPASAQTIVTANGGTNGGLGGTILIEGSADIPLPQFQVFGDGTLDLTNVSDNSMPIGSLAGDGIVLLSGHDLNVGNNNLSTTFSGVIQDDGSLSKAGTGTLTLSGRNTYTGGTTVSSGVLLVNRSGSSGTGTGPLAVNAGTLGGNGTIAGAVTVGTGTGAGAFLSPGQAATRLITLRIQSSLTFKADATYSYRLSTRKVTADQVVANGVTIESGAQFSFQAVANKRLSVGSVFTAINNTSANPIAGTFANLPDGSTFTSGRNNYQVSYEGGTGNDLTLTVQ
jgi:autotransporter-associated beta strand protein